MALAITDFVIEKMTQKYVIPPPFNLQDCFEQSNSTSPLIFVLSAGSDPMGNIMKFSEQWLREWVNPQIDTQELMDQITMAGLEVDGFEPVAGRRVGRVLARGAVVVERERRVKCVLHMTSVTQPTSRRQVVVHQVDQSLASKQVVKRRSL